MKRNKINWDLKLAIAKKFGSQVVGARALCIRESKLSYLVNGHAQPTRSERRVLAKALGGELVDRTFPSPQPKQTS